MEQQVLPNPKWEAEVSTRLANASADQIWPFFEDFFGFSKYFPGLPTSYGIHGSNGEFGSIRYCEGFLNPVQDNGVIIWVKEKLIDIDPTEMSLSYEIVDGNIGFSSYVASFKIIVDPVQGGSIVEWSFSVDPVEGWTLEYMVKKYEVWLQLMVQKMEDAVSNS